MSLDRQAKASVYATRGCCLVIMTVCVTLQPTRIQFYCHATTAAVTTATTTITSLQFYEPFEKRVPSTVVVGGSFSFWLHSWRKFDPIVHSFNRDLYAIVQLDVFSLLCRVEPVDQSCCCFFSWFPCFLACLLLCDLHNLQLLLLLLSLFNLICFRYCCCCCCNNYVKTC